MGVAKLVVCSLLTSMLKEAPEFIVHIIIISLSAQLAARIYLNKPKPHRIILATPRKKLPQ